MMRENISLNDNKMSGNIQSALYILTHLILQQPYEVYIIIYYCYYLNFTVEEPEKQTHLKSLS